MSWFKIDDGFHCHPKVFAAGTPAVGLYVRCGSWAAQQVTDGVVPRHVAKMYGTQRMAKALIDAGLWHQKGHNCHSCPEVDANSYFIHQYLERNPSRVDTDLARKAKSERQQRWREGKKNGQVNPADEPSVDVDVDASTSRHGDAAPDPTRPDPSSSLTEKKDSQPSASEEPPRADVERVCRHFANVIERGGGKKPRITKTWRNDVRLLLDVDGVTPEQAIAAIDWAHADSFWNAHILSPGKLRQKYETLRRQATTQRGQRAPQTGPATAPRDMTSEEKKSALRFG
ncbi:hypothetical protein ACWEG1_05790 [Streptomyces bauhiniae]